MVAQNATSLRRGLGILLELERNETAAGSGLGVTQLAAALGCDKSQISRSLRVLDDYGFVVRDPETLAYRLGWRILSMAGTSSHATLLAAAEPTLKRLTHELGERAHLSVLQGPAVLTILSEAPDRSVLTAGWVGRTVPLHSTSAGRALLLDYEPAELAELLGRRRLPASTPNAPRDARELYERIVAARVRGYAVVDEEFELGLVAVAAPVREYTGRIVAVVNVSAPKFRFGDRLDAAGASVKQSADQLSRALGWTGGRLAPTAAPDRVVAR